ncbi:MAG: response regulator [Chthoniobacteraceae bacterium]
MATRILVIEDEAITALDLKRELIALGFDVVGVEDNAHDAVRAAETLRPDLVLMDIQLAGGTDGITAASVIRGNGNIPVVFITAHSDRATLSRALAASPFGYVLKPFQVRELEVGIELALYKHAKEIEVRALVQDLETALANVRQLTGLVAICSACKKIRGADGCWQPLESFLSEHTGAKFSHGLCPDCGGNTPP